MDILVKTTQVILALSILVLVHECGHFFFARLFRMRVDKFYLFFNPVISLIRWKKINGKRQYRFFARNIPDKYRQVKNHFGEVVKDQKGKALYEEVPLDEIPADDWRREQDHTEYGVGWLPLGGYCKISGMIDESMDTRSMKKEPEPWEFRGKPAWQRFLVMFGGVLFNLIFAVLLYSAMLYTWGEEYLQNKDAVYGVSCSELAKEIGFRDGDMILAYDKVSLSTAAFRDLVGDLLRNRPNTITVLRLGDTVRFHFDEKYIPVILKEPYLFALRDDPDAPFVIGSIPKTSHNASSGLSVGDKVVGINGTPMNKALIQAALPLLANSAVEAQIEREGQMIDLPLYINEEGLIGVLLSPAFTFTTKSYTLFSALPAGAVKAYSTVAKYMQDLGLIFSPKTEAYKSVGSVITIGKIFPPTWDWNSFWFVTAFLSIMFAVLNMLPIPALDGGHILFVLYEMITRRKPGDKFLEYSQMIGMMLLLAIMALALGNDIFRLFK
ncbi:MAG: RIP metalloprotease RseP [Bacteroidales bacterium]|nr:RIP metalloprotease RseP [Bacteroidales bacterium]